MRQNVRLPAALASLNSGHSSDLRACCVGVRSSSRPNLVPARPLRPRSATWWSSLVANLSNTAPGRVLAIEVEAHEVASRCHVAATTLMRKVIGKKNIQIEKYNRFLVLYIQLGPSLFVLFVCLVPLVHFSLLKSSPTLCPLL